MAIRSGSGNLRPQRMVRSRMALRHKIFGLVVVAGVALGLNACQRSTAGSCSTAEDVAGKITALTDDLNSAQSAGHLSILLLGDIGAKIVDAGVRFGSNGNHQAYCTAIEKIRSDTRLH